MKFGDFVEMLSLGIKYQLNALVIEKKHVKTHSYKISIILLILKKYLKKYLKLIS